ncbi:MAG: Trm112 family protein [Pseudomonadota bacterium]
MADRETQRLDAVSDTTARAPDPRLLELLVCPLTKSSLDYRADRLELISRSARLAFPIVDGIPLLVLEAARPLTDADLP